MPRACFAPPLHARRARGPRVGSRARYLLEGPPARRPGRPSRESAPSMALKPLRRGCRQSPRFSTTETLQSGSSPLLAVGRRRAVGSVLNQHQVVGLADAALGVADGAQHQKGVGMPVLAFVARSAGRVGDSLAIAAAERRAVEASLIVRITLDAQASGGECTTRQIWWTICPASDALWPLGRRGGPAEKEGERFSASPARSRARYAPVIHSSLSRGTDSGGSLDAGRIGRTGARRAVMVLTTVPSKLVGLRPQIDEKKRHPSECRLRRRRHRSPAIARQHPRQASVRSATRCRCASTTERICRSTSRSRRVLGPSQSSNLNATRVASTSPRWRAVALRHRCG